MVHCMVLGDPDPGTHTGGRGRCRGRGHEFTKEYWENRPFHVNGASSVHERNINSTASRYRSRVSTVGIPLLRFAS